AEDEAVELFGLDPEDVEIAVQYLRRKAEIEEVLAAPPRRLGYQVQRQAPLAGEGLALAPGHAPDMLDPAMRMLGLGHEDVVIRVDDEPDRKPVHHRGLERFRGCQRHVILPNCPAELTAQ